MYKQIIIGVIFLISSLFFVSCDNSELEKLRGDNQSLLLQISSQNATIIQLNTSLNQTSNQLNLANIELTQTKILLSQTQEELAQINKRYPLKYFENLNELNSWIANHTKRITYDEVQCYWDALEIQKEAMLDGYIISIDVNNYWWAQLIALIGNKLYYWNPEDKVATYWETLEW